MTEEKAKEYSIETIEDIIKNVPTEKLDNFFEDLKIFIIEAKAFNKVVWKLPKEMIKDIKMTMKRVDDGEVWLKWTEVHLNIEK